VYSPPSIHISSVHSPSLIHILKHVFSTIDSDLKRARVCSPPLIHISSALVCVVLHRWLTSQACSCVFSTVDSHLKCVCVVHRWFPSQAWVCSPPLIHISSVGVFPTVDSHLECVCVLHRWFTSQVYVLDCCWFTHKWNWNWPNQKWNWNWNWLHYKWNGLGYQIMLRNMALVHWGNTTGAIL